MLLATYAGTVRTTAFVKTVFSPSGVLYMSSYTPLDATCTDSSVQLSLTLLPNLTSLVQEDNDVI